MTESESPSPVVSKKCAQWEGVRLEHYRLREGSFPEHAHAQHTAIVSLGEGCRGEVRTANGFRSAGRGAPGSVIVIPARRPHTISLDGPMEGVSLYLDPSAVARAASEAGGGGAGAEIVERRAQRDTVVSNVAAALLAESEREDGLYGRLYAESLANILAVHLLRNYSAAPAGRARFSGGLSGAALRRVMDYMADNYELDLSLSDLASEAGVSAFHFAREFKRSTGHAPHQYLIKLRVERAKNLLAESRLPIVEVGLRTGFGSQSHFTRLFRRLTGTTPGSYRGAFQN